MKSVDLPTKAQIEAVTDVAAIKGLLDDVEESTLHIQARLDNIDGDDDWRNRASGALAAHQYVERILRRRLRQLKPVSLGDAHSRPDTDCDPLTLEAFRGIADPDTAAMATVEECDDWFNRLGALIAAVASDREDEISLIAGERDERFLAASNRILASLKGMRVRVQTRRGEITRAAKQASGVERQCRREELFVQACRELLSKDVYQTLWDRVDRQELGQP